MKKKCIVGITGCRSEYDIIYPVLKAFQRDKNFDVSVVVCGAHLSANFGYTVQVIEEDGLPICERIHSLIDSDREVGKAKGAAILMSGLSECLDRLKPDFVVVVGDREEAIISGVVCTYLGIPLIHLCGGDRTEPKAGDVDEAVRHATSKMASLHFTMNATHRDRLLRMGEEPWRVRVVGDPALDRFQEIPRKSKKDILKYFGFESASDGHKPLVFIVQHVISGECREARRQIETTCSSVILPDANYIINYPNTDMGSREIIQIIEKYRSLPNVRVTKHIPRIEFVNLLRHLDIIIGNSSMALLEGSFLRIPAINIGQRNFNRMNGGNVVFTGVDRKEIEAVFKKILFDPRYAESLRKCRRVYGDGRASERIVSFVRKIKKSREKLVAKKITY